MQTVGCWLYKVSNIGTSRGRLTVTEGFSQGNSHHYQWFNVRHKNNSVILAQVFLHSPQAKFLILWVYLCVYHVNKYFYPDNCPPSATLVDKGRLFQLNRLIRHKMNTQTETRTFSSDNINSLAKWLQKVSHITALLVAHTYVNTHKHNPLSLKGFRFKYGMCLNRPIGNSGEIQMGWLTFGFETFS